MEIKFCKRKKEMNRHKAYWSVMGCEPSKERTATQEKRERHKKQLLNMINQYSNDGVFEVTRILREIIEEEK